MISLFKKSAPRVWTAVQWGPQGLSGVTVGSPDPSSRSGKPEVLACTHIPAFEWSSSTLADLAKQLQPSGAWVLLLEKEDYIILSLPEPAVQPDELEASVRWAVAEQLEYPVDQAQLSWMKIPTVERLPNRPPQMYVIASPSAVVSNYARMFKEARLQLSVADIPETAQRNIATLAASAGEGVCLLRSDSNGTEFTVSFEGELYLDRFVREPLIDRSGAFTHDVDDVMGRIGLQVQRSLDYVDRNLPFIPVKNVILAPGAASDKLAGFLSVNTTFPVERLDLSTLFDISKVPDLAHPEVQSQYFTALGACLRYL